MFLDVELLLLSLLYSSLIIQSSNFCLGLPLPLLPSILPFIISLCSESPLIICRIQFRCLVLIIKDLSSSTSFNTSFDMCSFQLIFSVLHHILISKASNLVMSSFLIVHFLHSTRSHFKSVLSPFFSRGIFILLNPPLGNSFLLEKASFSLLSRGVNPGG